MPTEPRPSAGTASSPGSPTELVLAMVAEIPAGRATTYGLLAEGVGEITGKRMAALAVGRAMGHNDGSLAWWRVIRSDGGMVEHLHERAVEHWQGEAIPLLPGREPARVDLRACLWDPVTESATVARLRTEGTEGTEGTPGSNGTAGTDA